jgi:teichuronic acid biosynthesis glycosyltransferase TuaC
METVRAVWLVSRYPSEANSAPGIFHRTQVEALRRHGITVDVVAPTPWVPPFFDRLSERWRSYTLDPEIEVRTGVRVFRPRYLATPGENVWGAPHLHMLATVGRLPLEPPQVIHAHYAYPQGIIALRLAARRQVPVVLTLHGSDVNSYPDLSPFSRARFTHAVTEASAVIAVSHALADRTEARTGRKPLAMPIGINLRPYAHLPAKVDARRALGLPQDRFLVLYIGRMLDTKGIRELLCAMGTLTGEGVSAVLVGPGPLVREARATPGVIAVGMQPNEMVPLYLSAVDAFILPSYAEGLPTVVVEAGAAGVPVIATRIGGIEELIDDHSGYLIAPRDVEDIVLTVRAVQQHPHLAAARGRAFQQVVRTQYDADENSRHLAALYHELCRGSTAC